MGMEANDESKVCSIADLWYIIHLDGLPQLYSLPLRDDCPPPIRFPVQLWMCIVYLRDFTYSARLKVVRLQQQFVGHGSRHHGTLPGSTRTFLLRV